MSQIQLPSLKEQITNFEDYQSAELITEKLYLDRFSNNRESKFIGIGCKTLLIGSILLAAQTKYPDLLTVKTFLSLEAFTKRLIFAKRNKKLRSFGNKVADILEGFITFPEDANLRELVVIEPIEALDNYLKEFASNPASLRSREIMVRTEYLNEIFPTKSNQFLFLVDKSVTFDTN